MIQVLGKILLELQQINKRLADMEGPQCPHGSSGFCMPCFRDSGIGWEIAQELKK